jgi:diadenosine tetraphosphate (Ap4A) HIT family hydrolase
MATRSPKEEKVYKAHRKNEHSKTSCIFCDIGPGHMQLVRETKSFKIVRNIFPYSHWDGQDVVDHLMIVPKLHTDTLSDLQSHEAIEYVELMSSYESQGYNVYARAPQSNRKTVVHQHTHLIKLNGKNRKFLLYLEKPHVRLVR